MPKAVWNGVVIAESDDTVIVEGNHYFPMDSVMEGSLVPTDSSSVCHWKGTATYLTVRAGGEENPDAAWTYPEPKEAASHIADHVAFWRGVTVQH